MKTKRNRERGCVLVEFTVTTMVLLPVIVFIILAAVDAGYFFALRNAMGNAANRAARDIAVEYSKNTNIAHDQGMQNSFVFSKITVPGMKTQSTADFRESTTGLSFVTVTTEYTDIYPLPDPLNLRTMNKTMKATYRLYKRPENTSTI